MKNIQKIIENIVTKEPNPDPKYAPHIVLRWYTKTEGQTVRKRRAIDSTLDYGEVFNRRG